MDGASMSRSATPPIRRSRSRLRMASRRPSPEASGPPSPPPPETSCGERDQLGAVDVGALTVVGDGVVYAGSLAPHGDNMYALDAATGAVKWAFASGGSVASGPAVVNGVVYWGSGYKIGGINGVNNKLYAFELAGE